MALQDVCGFQDTIMHIPAPLCMSLEDTTSTLHVKDEHSLGWRNLASSERTGGVPLHFFIPTLPNSAHFPGRNSSLFSPSTSSTTVQRPFSLSHGTTTLAFIFQGGVIAAADTRASAGGLVACPAVQKITPVHSHLVVTSSGGGADCMLWERILVREIRLYQLRHRRRLSISGTAKLLSYMLHPFKGTDVCVALTLCGWDKDECTKNVVDRVMGSEDSVNNTTTVDLKQIGTSSHVGFAAAVSDQAVTDTSHSASPPGGPKLIFVCSDGTRLQGELFSVGSGSPYAYGVLDGGLRWSLSKEEAVSLAREAVFRATHRDAYSGNNVDLYHITAQGWSRRDREDLREEYYRERERIVKRVEERKRVVTE